MGLLDIFRSKEQEPETTDDEWPEELSNKEESFGNFDDFPRYGVEVGPSSKPKDPEHEADSVVIEPATSDVSVSLVKGVIEKQIKPDLVGMTFSSGDELDLVQFPDDDFFTTEKIHMRIRSIEPDGPAEIKEDTSIVWNKQVETKDGLPESQVFTVSKLPDLDDWGELDSFTDVKHLADKGASIGKYTSNEEIVYLIDPYYFRRSD